MKNDIPDSESLKLSIPAVLSEAAEFAKQGTPPEKFPPELLGKAFAALALAETHLRHVRERQRLSTLLEEFCRSVHQSLDVKPAAYTIANEGRRLIECDRASVALRDGRTCPVIAVSGQDTIHKRATAVRLLGKLAAAVIKAGEPVWYTGDTADLPPQIEKAIENYADHSHCKMLAVVPLLRNKNKNAAEDEDKPKKRKTVNTAFGAFIVEQFDDGRIPDSLRKRIDTVAEHAAAALGNALEHRSILFLPVWKTLGKAKRLFAADLLPKTASVMILVSVLAAVLIFMPWKFQMHCTGTLEPVNVRRIYSPLDAEVKQLFVNHNDPVVGPSVEADGIEYRGTTLLELRSPELESLDAQLHGEQQEITEKMASLTRMLQGQLNDYDRADLVGQMERAKIQHETVRKKLQIFELKQKPELMMTSPMKGTVVSWDIQRRLSEKRPVSRMQYLLEIADLEGAWQLELSMPEKRMGRIMDRQKQLPDGRLRVEFVLATDPAAKYYGTVSEIHDRAEVRSDTGSASAASDSLNTVLIKVALDDQKSLPAALRPGAECRARIDCGTRPLGYVLFYEVIAFVQKNVWFRWF
ncbi:MAG: HlyD family efflux transporter periplasmic adaptor subunit [Planctomycetaceae bacterium]|jgi:hypothetical protein|nr:HlyD family efflux transporter periplasmic adaptor subunit [Planctomycetaceae bacterium]